MKTSTVSLLTLVALGASLLPAAARDVIVYRPAPRPVYVAPRPVYVQPRPVVVQPQPVYRPAPRGVVVESDMGWEVQRALAKRRYYRGPIDGQVGPQTRAAIRTYQVDKGLPVTGRIDRYLLKSLRLIR